LGAAAIGSDFTVKSSAWDLVAPPTPAAAALISAVAASRRSGGGTHPAYIAPTVTHRDLRTLHSFAIATD
jgi:hypothetical protein